MNWMIDMNEELKSNKIFGLRNGTIKSFIRKEITEGGRVNIKNNHCNDCDAM